MKVIIAQSELKRGLFVVSRAVAPPRNANSLPVLANVLIRTAPDGLFFVGTDLSMMITCRIGAKVEREGAITLPQRLLADVVNYLSGDVCLELDEKTQTVTITSDTTVTNIKGIEAEDFPPILTVEERIKLTLPCETLMTAVGQVAGAASSDDSRSVLTAVLLRGDGQVASFVAADGYRLAVRRFPYEEEIPDTLIPAKSLIEGAKILPKDGDVTVVVEKTLVAFRTDDIEIVTRLVEGKFPDFERIIPTEHAARAVANVQEIKETLRLVRYFAQQNQGYTKMQFTPTGDDAMGGIVFSAKASDIGDGGGDVTCLVEGNPVNIVANIAYLLDAVNGVLSLQVAIEVQEHRNPIVFRPVDANDYIHIVMPMTMSG